MMTTKNTPVKKTTTKVAKSPEKTAKLRSVSNEDLRKYPELKKKGYKLGDAIDAKEWTKIEEAYAKKHQDEL